METWVIVSLCLGGFLVSYIGLTAIFSRLFEDSNEEILVDGTTTTVNKHRASYGTLIIMILVLRYVYAPANDSVEKEKNTTHQTAIEYKTTITHNEQNISSLYVAANPIMFKFFTDLRIKDNIYYKKSFLTEHGKKKLLLLIIPFVLIILKIFFKVEFLKNFYPTLILFLIFFVVSGAYTQYFLDNQDQYMHSLKNTETR